MKNITLFRWILTGTAFLALIALMTVPAGATYNETHPSHTTPASYAPPYMYDTYKSVYTNSDPDKQYGEEFASPDRIHVGYGVGTSGEDPEHDLYWDVSWHFEFWLTPSQYDQMNKCFSEDPYVSLLGTMSQLVPDQVAALPDDLKQFLVDSNCDNPMLMTQYSSYDQPFALYSVPNQEYTDEVKVHLLNLGLSPEYDVVGLTMTTQPPDGEVLVLSTGDTLQQSKIVMEGNAPDGTRKSWTFVLKAVPCISPNGDVYDYGVVWWNVDEDRESNDDEWYLISALGYSRPFRPLSVARASAEKGTEKKVPPQSPVSLVSHNVVPGGKTGESPVIDLLNIYERNNKSFRSNISLPSRAFESNGPDALSSVSTGGNLSGHSDFQGATSSAILGVQERRSLLSARLDEDPTVACSPGPSYVSRLGKTSGTSPAASLIASRYASGVSLDRAGLAGLG
jgi:hypothetical protein